MWLDDFFARVAGAPDAIAVQDGERRLTYRELAGHASRLASRLTAARVGRDSVVAVYGDRSAELVVGELAVLLAGAAYLPLDPAHPAARTSELLALSGAAAIVTAGSASADKTPFVNYDSQSIFTADAGRVVSGAPVGLPFVNYDSQSTFTADAGRVVSGGAPVGLPFVNYDSQSILPVDLTEAARSAPVRPPRSHDAALAYVIHTSGSTGRPKGVAVTHGSLANLMGWHQRSYRLGPGDRTTLLVSPGFDVSVWDTWPTLASGGTLVVPPAGVRTSPCDLVAWLADERITVTFLPTPLAEAVLAEEWPEHTVLRLLHTGGSAMQRGVPDGLPFTVVNVYGPAECTVGVTTAAVLPGGPVPPPIGVPIDGVRCYVLDGLDPVPDGEAGEMCLAGECVARGYLGDPAGTARSFVPGIGAPGRRMYRTGDRVRRRADGVLEYLGRFDDQVKIRGFRIEPGEVAAVLRQHPAVRDSFVTAHPAGPDGARLIGYVATDAAPGELIEFAADRLPGYMVPAAVVVLPELPLTPNGKVDRAALPAPDRVAAGLAGTAAPGRTPTEKELAGIVARLLGVDEVGSGDDFFALGGTSLLVGRLATQIASELRVTVGLRELYGARTVTAIAAIIDQRTAASEAGQPAVPASTAASQPAVAVQFAAIPQPVAVPKFAAVPGSVAVPPGRPPISRAPRNRPIPLSLPQERVWFFEQLSPGNLAYNFQATLALRGEVDVAVLRAALDEIVRRHEILRTGFVAVDGVAQARPVAKAKAPLRVLDVPAEHAEKVITAELRKPFDVSRPPLARWLLLRHGAGENTFLHMEHHFVHDGWSLGVLLSELSALYQAFAAGRPSPLPELAVQYADYALWQRDWMRGEVLAAHVDHWTSRLAGAPTVLELPTDRPRPPVMTFRGAAPRIRIPAGLSRALRAFSREHRVSLFSTMYAGFAALLYRYTGQQDLLVGTGVANRSAPGLEPLLGMLVNTLVLRSEVSGGQSFTDLLGQVQQSVAEVLAWSDTPVDAVIDAIGPPRDASRTPLFQVMFSFHDSAVPDLEFGGLSGKVTERTNGSAKTDLNVIVIPRAAQRLGRAPRAEDDDLTMIWEYSTELFDEATMSRMVSHYLTLLADAVARPATRVSGLRLLDDAEEQQLLDWGRGPVVAGARPVTELVAHWAHSTPEATAVTDASLTMTYRELDRRAGQLAATLAGLGAGPGSVVAMYAGRSSQLVLGQLAVLKAGAAYLPLDPDYPAHWVAELLTGSRAAVLLTTSSLAGNLPAFVGPTLLLDQMPDHAGEQPVAARVRPDSLAYVIYTSGSTGRPKGVQATHGGLANVTGWLRETYQHGPGDRSALVASPAFDGSVWEIWPALTSGGTLVVPPEDIRVVPRDLAAWMVRQRITWAFLPTPLAEAMLDEHWPADAALRFLLTGGDAIRRVTPPGLPFTFVNHYGPTETTVIVTETPVPPGGPARPPIGRPLGGALAYVLDGLDPVPIGVPGELCIGGAGVTRGYVDDPAATAARFVPDPWHPGQRMYRTGDRVRWLADGRLDFLGRLDDQVKIRGFRIEPGEIAAALRQHPRVGDAVVVPRPDATGRLRLIGYAETAASPADLRAFLAGRLPSYLVPDQLVPMVKLPWNPNGKVDKAALPLPGGWTAGPSLAPRSDTERRIARLWQDLLGVDAVGADDDFFGLGGYSLLVARMIAQVNELFECSVPLSVFLSAPTLAGLASAVGQSGSVRRPGPVPTGPEEFADEIDLDTLSDAEAAALLAVLAGDGEGP